MNERTRQMIESFRELHAALEEKVERLTKDLDLAWCFNITYPSPEPAPSPEQDLEPIPTADEFCENCAHLQIFENGIAICGLHGGETTPADWCAAWCDAWQRGRV